MAVQMTITVDGVADSLEDLQAAVAYFNTREDVVSVTRDDNSLTVRAIVATTEWVSE